MGVVATPRSGARQLPPDTFRGAGFAYGGAAGYAVLGMASAVVRPGWFFATRRDAWVNGSVSLGLAPIVDVTAHGDARLTLTLQPGFSIAVERFTFGLGMLVGAVVLTSVPGESTGFDVGAILSMGATI